MKKRSYAKSSAWLTQEIATKADISHAAADRVLKELPDILFDEILHGRSVHIYRLGWFEPQLVKARHRYIGGRIGAVILCRSSVRMRLRLAIGTRLKLAKLWRQRQAAIERQKAAAASSDVVDGQSNYDSA